MLRYENQWQTLGARNYYLASAGEPPFRTEEGLMGIHKVDVGIVGGGFAGLSAGLELAQMGYSVVVLEARHIGFGASARNGGQALTGFSCPQETLEKHWGLERAQLAWSMSLDAINLIRTRINQHHINCDWVDGFYLAGAKRASIASLQNYAERMEKIYGFGHTFIRGDDMPEHIDSPRYVCALHEKVSGHLHPVKYLYGLAKTAMDADCRIVTQAEVTELILGEGGKGAVIKTNTGELHCDFALLSGNALMTNINPVVGKTLISRILPVGTYIGATEPMDEATANRLIRARACVCDDKFVLDYFRVSADNRLLFGGRVNYTNRVPHDLPATMKAGMVRVFPQLSALSMEFAWGGYVDITLSRAPDFGRLSPTVYYLQGFSGHGVALAGLAGQMVAQAINGQAGRFDGLADFPNRVFPGGAWLQSPLYALGMLYYRLRDWL